LIGGGLDPTRSEAVLQAKTPQDAAEYLRNSEDERLKRIRETVITAPNHIPIKVEEVVEGGAVRSPDELGEAGVVVGNQPRLGRISLSHPELDAEGEEVYDENDERKWVDEPDKVQGIVLLRKGEHSKPALHDLEEKIRELNEASGRLLPGMK